MKDTDPDIKEMAEMEFDSLKKDIEDLENDLKKLLLPKDPDDSGCLSGDKGWNRRMKQLCSLAIFIECIHDCLREIIGIWKL